jgi:hypothetical protein
VAISSAVVGLVGTVGSGLIQSNAAGQAGRAASNADQEAALLQEQAGQQANAQDIAQYNYERSSLAPYINNGQNASNALARLTGSGPGGNGIGQLTAQFTGANLASTPGYQFTLQQGLESTQNGFAAQGLASSGAAIKGAGNYATGLAQSTYNQQLQNYLSQNQQIYNMLNGEAQNGLNASSNLGNSGALIAGSNALTGAAAGAGSAITAGGAAQAGGITGSAAPYGNALGTIGNLGGAYALNQLQGQSGYTNTDPAQYQPDQYAVQAGAGISPAYGQNGAAN